MRDGRGETQLSLVEQLGAAYWWRSDLGVTRSGSDVTAWKCQITGTLLEPPATAPQYVAAVQEFGGKPAIAFDSAFGRSLLANNPASAWRFLHDGTGCTVVPVFKTRAAVDAMGLWGTASGDTATVGSCQTFYSTFFQYYQYFVTNGAGRPVNAQSPLLEGGTYDTARVFRHSYTSTPVEGHANRSYLGGRELSSAITGVTPAAGDPESALRVGCVSALGGAASQFGTFDLAEFIVLPRALLAAEWALLYASLSSRYAPAPAYAGIYVDAGVTTQVTNATPGSYDVMTGFNTAQGFNNASAVITPAKASNSITLDESGVYTYRLSASFSGTGSTTYTSAVFLDGVRIPGSTLRRKIANGTDIGANAARGFVVATAGQVLTARVAADGASANYLPEYVALSAQRLGGL